MTDKQLIEKVESGVAITREEFNEYKKLVKPKVQVYGKYGTIALRYMEEHQFGKFLSLAGELPDYLHNLDKQADDLYDVLYNKLSNSEEYKRTGDYLYDVRRIGAMQKVIEEEILNTLVYID